MINIYIILIEIRIKKLDPYTLFKQTDPKHCKKYNPSESGNNCGCAAI